MRAGQEIMAHVKALVALLDGNGSTDEPSPRRYEIDETEPSLQRLVAAKTWLRASAVRLQALGTAPAADPAWDMLLTIYVDAAAGRHVSVSSACFAASVPATTALRHLSTLEASGWLLREPDRRDHRRKFLHLTEKARGRIEIALDAMAGENRRARLETTRTATA